MHRFTAVSLFCEDIRSEATGQDSIIGVFSDSISLGNFPATFPRLSIYTRLNFDIDFDIEGLELKIVDSTGKVISRNSLDAELIASNRTDARAKGNPTYGFIMRTVMGLFTIAAPDLIRANVTVNGEETLTGLVAISQS
jgi:hypothetical protein